MMNSVVIGVGAEWQGAGPLVVYLLRHMNVPDVRLVESDGDPAELVELWDEADLAVVVEGLPADDSPGRIHRLATLDPTVATGASPGSVSAAAGLGESLGRMPRRLMAYGIETGPDLADALTPPVRQACQQLAAQIFDLVAV